MNLSKQETCANTNHDIYFSAGCYYIADSSQPHKKSIAEGPWCSPWFVSSGSTAGVVLMMIEFECILPRSIQIGNPISLTRLCICTCSVYYN